MVRPVVEVRWKDRMEEPLNRFYRYPVARLMVRALVHTPISANQVTAIQPFIAFVAAYCLTLPGHRGLLLAVLVFELRTVLDCADGTLARAKGTASPSGHAIDGICDWLSTVILHGGLLVRLQQMQLPATTFGVSLGVRAVLCLALLQAALRSFAADHYLNHLGPIFDRGRDESEAALRAKIRKATPGFFAGAEIFIGRMGHLVLQGKWVGADDAHGGSPEPHPLHAFKDAPGTRALGIAWSLSSGDAYLSWLMLSFALDAPWQGQVLFATVGFAQILTLILVTAAWVRRRSAATA
jgi:phosphatidylglycerophosphate synthase